MSGTGSSSQTDLELALSLADLADSITLARYRATDLKVETKPDSTPVTESDQAAERALRARLAQERPGDQIVGEEFGGGEPSLEGAGRKGQPDSSGPRRRWIIDPIDGTKSYLRGIPTWSTLIALEEDAAVTVGVVSMPALGMRWWARRGAGAYAAGDRRIHVSAVSRLADAHMLWSGIEDWSAAGMPDRPLALAAECWRSRGIGDAWQYMLVAEGAGEIACDPAVKLWDLAAVKVIVEEAGGRFTDLAGRDTADGGSGLATNGHVHEAALRILGSGA